MLTIFALTNAKQAAQYYEKDNYYLQGSKEAVDKTHWWGRGAEKLGLKGYIDPAQFTQLLEGDLGGGVKLGRVRHDGGVEHKPGYDLTFSAPKSVSVLAEIGKDYRLHNAHNVAVNAALAYLQSSVALYRQTSNAHTEVKQADNLIVGKFRHDTSRSVEDTIDCQLHTHCVVINATQGEDGQWRSLFEKPIFDFKMVGGMVYRSVLAKELKSLGYTIEKTREDGLFEISGFKRDQIEAFSKRRVKIVEVMEELGLFGAKAAQAVTLGVRENKVPINREKLDEHWQDRIKDLDVDLSEIIDHSKKRVRDGIDLAITSDPAADSALNYAIKHLDERQSVFKEKDIIKTTLQYALGDLLINDVTDAITQMKASGQLVFLGDQQFQKLYTSDKILEQEQKIIEIMKKGKNEFDPIASHEVIDLYLDDLTNRAPQTKKPTQCQLKAIRFLGTSTDRIVGVQGYAGTGKTTMLNAVCRIAEQAGYAIRGAAPSASAADVLRSDTGLKADTLSGLLLDLKKQKPRVKHQKPELIILDEASMASTHQMLNLMEVAIKLNKRVLLVGDRQQLPSVENGSPFSLLQDEGMNQAILTQVVRQESPDLAFAVKETIQGDLEYAVRAIGNEAFINHHSDGEALFSPESCVKEVKDKNRRLSDIAKDYLSLDDKGRDNTIVLLGSNEDREEVNELIRDGLKEKGKFQGIDHSCSILKSKDMTNIERTHIFNFEIGDIIHFNKAYRSLGIKRYDYLSIVEIDQIKETLVFNKNGKRICWKPGGSAQSKGGAIEVFQRDSSNISAGDFIRWTKNKKSHEVYNTETAKVMSLLGSVAKIKLKTGKTIDIDLTKNTNKHWDYAWSSTVYSAQGKKANNVIAQLESYNPHLTNFRSFYVTLSRAVNKITLYVDNLEESVNTIKKHTGEKSNATTFLQAHLEKKQFEQYIKHAYTKLDGKVHEYVNESSRLVNLAGHYANLFKTKTPYLLATDYKDRNTLNALIRTALKKQGLLNHEDHSAISLREYYINGDGKQNKIKQGMIIHFERGYKKLGIRSGEYLRVDGVDVILNKTILKHHSGDEIQVDISFIAKRQKKEIRVYQRDELSLSEGDKIIWTKTDKKAGLLKNKYAIVRNILQDTIMFELENKQLKLFKKSDAVSMHWQYAYAQGLNLPPPKQYDIAIAHLDEKLKSPARLSAIFGAMGKAKRSAHIYTHSIDYVNHELEFLTKQDACLGATNVNVIQNQFYDLLEKFKHTKKIVGNAWVSYFEKKSNGDNVEKPLKNALILDKMRDEIAHRVITSDSFDENKVSALGFDANKLKHLSEKHQVNQLVEKYENANGLSRGHLACLISSDTKRFSKALNQRNILHKTIFDDALDYRKKLESLTLTPEARQNRQYIDAYFNYSVEAGKLWRRIYRAKEYNNQPDISKFNYACHVITLRNQLAKEMTINPDKYEYYLNRINAKALAQIKRHSKDHDETLIQSIKKKQIVNTKNWRQVVGYEESLKSQPQIGHYENQNKNKKTYWDKDYVLREIMPKAESIISSIINEEKNTKLSRANRIVWGKKHGSVHLHLSGEKEGVVNDYERGIHGDIITYYAKRRGVAWYDALSELASEVGLNPEQGGIKQTLITPEEKAKKEQTILKEQKRRERMRQLAQRTWDESKPISDTVVESYLKKHRKIMVDVNKIEVRYHPKVPNIISYNNNQLRIGDRRPAMVVSFLNDQNELTGIQCTYLDKVTQNKDKSVQIPKCTIGQVWGGAGIIFKGGEEKVIVSEGAETAMSLIHCEPKSTIYITGGNMQNIQHFDYLALQHDEKEIYIAADNDLSENSGSWKATEAGARKLAEKGIKPIVSQPDAIKGQKTDFNDVMKEYDSREVKRQFSPKYFFDPQCNITDDTKMCSIDLTPKSAKRTTKNNSFKVPDLKLRSHTLDTENKDIIKER